MKCFLFGEYFFGSYIDNFGLYVNIKYIFNGLKGILLDFKKWGVEDCILFWNLWKNI